jgi:hypothetical protein
VTTAEEAAPFAVAGDWGCCCRNDGRAQAVVGIEEDRKKACIFAACAQCERALAQRYGVCYPLEWRDGWTGE